MSTENLAALAGREEPPSRSSSDRGVSAPLLFTSPAGLRPRIEASQEGIGMQVDERGKRRCSIGSHEKVSGIEADVLTRQPGSLRPVSSAVERWRGWYWYLGIDFE